MVKKSGLGKGLSALIPVSTETDNPSDRYEEVSLDLLDPNPEQPRHHFHQERLNELADSIKTNGVIQPIIVTPSKNRYVVIAGERRWRATRLAGYEKIPAIIRRVNKDQMLSLALLENIQRQELNPIEEALAYGRLLETNKFTHETLATHLGKSRVSITNTVRLLKLPDSVKNFIQDGKLTFGHARSLVGIDNEERLLRLAKACIEKSWSVRELERRIQMEREERKERAKVKKPQTILDTEKRLTSMLKSKVSIAGDGKKGKIVLTYGSEEEFSKIMNFFQSETEL